MHIRSNVVYVQAWFVKFWTCSLLYGLIEFILFHYAGVQNKHCRKTMSVDANNELKSYLYKPFVI